MLYQLDSYLLDGIILLLDFIVVGLLVYLFRQPRDVFYKWWAILALVLLALTLSAPWLLRQASSLSETLSNAWLNCIICSTA